MDDLINKFATREELLLVQKILDKFNYPYLIEITLDNYWHLSDEGDLWWGFYKDQLEYCDETEGQVRIAGDFIMVNCRLCTGETITRVFSWDKQLDERDGNNNW